jgi:hypothetical protein
MFSSSWQSVGALAQGKGNAQARPGGAFIRPVDPNHRPTSKPRSDGSQTLVAGILESERVREFELHPPLHVLSMT